MKSSLVVIPFIMTIVSVVTINFSKAAYEDLHLVGNRDSLKPNIVVLVFDALRADHIGMVVNNNSITPTIDSLAANGRVYTTCFSTSTWTFPSTVSIMTSKLPNKLGLHARRSLPEDLITMPGILRDNGYYTVGISTNQFFGTSDGFHRLFDKFILDLGSGQTQLLLPFKLLFADKKIFGELAYQLGFITAEYMAGGWDKVNMTAARLIEQSPEIPLFIYLHYMETHGPYRAKSYEHYTLDFKLLAKPSFGTPPTDAYKREPDNRLAEHTRKMLKRYLDGVEVADKAVADILNMLEELGLAENTILFITSDHGEEFYEHNAWVHGTSLFHEQIAVPLVIYIPPKLGINLPEYEGNVSLMDIMPTVLDLAGINVDSQEIDGLSLMKPQLDSSRPIYSILETAGVLISTVIKEPYKLIRIYNQKTNTIDTLLFDLVNDPREKVNLYPEQRHIADSLAVYLQEQLDQTVELPSLSERQLSPQNIERLRALGYVN